jgi:hypothetical protein
LLRRAEGFLAKWDPLTVACHGESFNSNKSSVAAADRLRTTVKFLVPCSQTKQRVAGIAQHIEHHTLPAALSAEYTRVLVLLAAQLLTNTPTPCPPAESNPTLTPPINWKLGTSSEICMNFRTGNSGVSDDSHLLYTPCSTEGGGQSHAFSGSRGSRTEKGNPPLLFMLNHV